MATNDPRFAEHLTDRAIRQRMARANKRAESALRRTFRSTAKKWREYYGHDTGRASFAFYAGADSAKAATELQQLGARVSFLEPSPSARADESKRPPPVWSVLCT